MNAAQCFRFFPKMSYGASRAWVNISLARSAIDVWLSGALTLKRSVDLDSVLSMAARYELKSDLLQAREQSLEDPERLFCLEGSIRPDGELTKAGFLARAGKLCAIEMSAPVSLDRLLEEGVSGLFAVRPGQDESMEDDCRGKCRTRISAAKAIAAT